MQHDHEGSYAAQPIEMRRPGGGNFALTVDSLAGRADDVP